MDEHLKTTKMDRLTRERITPDNIGCHLTQTQSLSNIQKLLLADRTDSGNRNRKFYLGPEADEKRCHSQPCSPRVKRKVLRTCIKGTHYMIGK